MGRRADPAGGSGVPMLRARDPRIGAFAPELPGGLRLRRPQSHAALGLSLFQLGLEAQTVIALRLLKLATGALRPEEARRMVSEKIDAAIVANGHLTTALLSGAPADGPRKALSHYRRKVRANRRRLSK